MNTINWSVEQENAITYKTATQGSAVVSAAAGSGKTAVLVERIIRMITDEDRNIPADSIVAVTFTDAAAGELKSRLQEKINQKINEKIAQSSGNIWLEEQLIRLENAHICTISAFCIGLLREFAQDLGLNADFKICEGKESEGFSDKALNRALESIYDGENFTKAEKSALFAMTGEAGDSKLGRAVTELYTEYIKQPFPEKWLNERSALFEKPESLKKLIADNSEFSESAIQQKAQACLSDIATCMEHSYSDSMEKRLNEDRDFAESWANADLSKREKGLLKYGNSAYGNPAEKHREAKNLIKSIRDEYIKTFKEIIVTAGLLLDFDFVAGRQAEQVKAFVKLFRNYAGEFSRLKLENNRVDFSDAEHYCLKLMQNSEIADKVKNTFYEIIVDEFQDSNAVQYEIFKSISKNRKNLFFVGDVKQSIYRFRNADPRVFVNVSEDENFTTLTLNKNFRSSPEVVAAVNNIFEKNMTREVGGVDYNNDAKLVFGANNPGGERNNAELVIIENSETGENDKVKEANYIAARIKQMVAEKFQVADKDGSTRSCGYGDFAVLISGLSTVEDEFSAAFETFHIPFDKQKSGDYSEVPEIKTILSLLTIIESPFEDMELLKTLCSPLYGFTARDIAEIRAFEHGENSRFAGFFNSLFDNVENYQKTEKPSPAYNKARKFYEDFRRRNAYVKNHGACKLLRLLFDEGAFAPLIASSYNPEKTLVNVRLLLHYSESLKSLTKDTLFGLIAAVKGENGGVKLEEAKGFNSLTDEGDSDSEGAEKSGKVKLMTIHASKGLEFPVCFVARCNARFNLRENYSDIIFSEKTGFAMRYIIPETNTRCDTLTHANAKRENENAAISEEMRKLYVAATRAKDKLIFTAVCGIDEDTGEINYTEKSYLSWLMNTDIARIIAETVQDVAIEENIEKTQTNNFDTQAEIREIITAVNKTYSRTTLTEIPRRVTATQIGVSDNAELRDTLDEPMVFPRSASFMGSRKLTGKKRGDAYHKMMELIDFKAGDFENQIKAQRTAFTEEEFAVIEPQKIIGFFNSPLGKRAIASNKVQKEFMLCTEISLSELGYPKEYDEKYPDQKPFVQGIADMFFYENGEIILIDYKTNKNANPEKLKEQYRGQLEIYARAIEEMTGVKVKEKWIYLFEGGTAVDS